MLLVCPNCSTSYQLNISSFGAAGREVRCARCRYVWVARDSAPVDAVAVAADEPAAAPTVAAEVPPPPPEEEHRPAHEERAEVEPAPLPADEAPPLAPEEDDIVAVPIGHEPKRVQGKQSPFGRLFGFLPTLSKPKIALPSLPGRQRFNSAARSLGIAAHIKPAYVVAALALIVAALIFARMQIVHMLPQMASLYDKFGAETNLRGLVFDEMKASTDLEDGKAVLLIEGTIRNITGSTIEVPRLRFAVRNASGADIYAWTEPPERNTLKSGEWLRFRTRLASPPQATRDAYVRFLTRDDIAGGTN